MVSREVLLEYRDAILTLNSDKVQELLNQGIPANLRIEKTHPIQWVMMVDEEDITNFLQYNKERKDLLKEIPKGIDYKIQARNTVAVLLENGVNLISKDDSKFVHGDADVYMVDTILQSSNKEAVADVILNTLKQSIEEREYPYRFLNASYYGGLVQSYISDKSDVFVSKLEKQIERMQELHDMVAMRLANPQTDLEKDLVTNYPEETEFWIDSFEKPNIAKIMDNVNHMGERYIEFIEKQDAIAVEELKKYKVGVDISMQKMEYDAEKGIYILPEETPQEVLRDLQTLVGLEKEKKDFLKWAIEITKSDSSDPEEIVGYSSAYLGNPGTAKTTLTRMKVRFLHSLGLVGDTYAEGTAKNLIADYVGQTRTKAAAFLNKADTVFIDEAYGLYGEGSRYNYGAQAVDVLVDYIENNRENPVFFAGYPDSMQKLFTMNEGLISRIRSVSTIDDYDIETLGEIFDKGLEARGYKGIDDDAREKLLDDLEYHRGKVDPKFFGNAREVRLVLDNLNGAVKDRYYQLDKALEDADDLVGSFNMVSSKKPIRKKDMVVTIADIESLELREKHKTIEASNNSRPIGFRSDNDNKKSKTEVAAQFNEEVEGKNGSVNNCIKFPKKGGPVKRQIGFVQN